MLDIKLIRADAETIRKNLARRNNPAVLERFDTLLKADESYRNALRTVEQLRHKRNLITQEISNLKKAGKDITAAANEAKRIPQEMTEAEEDVKCQEELLQRLLLKTPNLLHDSVPQGADETGNQVVKTWGAIKKPAFPLKSHVDLLQSLDIADLDRAANVAGARFYYLKRELVLLDIALVQFALQRLYAKRYIPIYPPFMMRRKPYEGVTDLADFEEVLYKIENEDLYLIATSEHPMGAMHMGEVLVSEQLPLRYAGISTCFRKEAGSHGKDTKGIFRVHQFTKIEQFIFCKAEDSWRIHEELLANAEEIFQALELPYRVVNICTGDIGCVAAKKYDIEAWMPVQQAYREVVSCSNCTDYQARRLNIRWGKEGGYKELAHTLNSTAIATSRAMVAILENNQQEDGSVLIPKVLRPYMGGIERIGMLR
ncbi:serine--tRNA ligase [Candidatus Woesearchaeota archaeon]|nr:serine--tRNA ligase [Candidatus Woesearchaeota archaeon]